MINRKTVIRTFLLFFLPVTLLIGAVIAAFHVSDIKSATSRTEFEENNVVEAQTGIINSELGMISGDLLFVSKHICLQKMMREGEDEKPGVAQNFTILARIRKLYDQIRYIDEKGMEIVRVNYNNGNIYIVPDEMLQSKANRYYFKDSFRLNEDEIYISPFDLNIERGALELPLKPTIRIATPAFDDLGAKRGVVIFNYLGNSLFERIHAVAREKFEHIMLVNREGYFLKGINPEDEWGFMIEDRKEKNMASMFPIAWQQIKSGEKGQFYTPAGLFTFNTISPLRSTYKSSTGSSFAFGESDKQLQGDDYHWKIISFFPAQKMKSGNRSVLLERLGFFGLMAMLAAAGSYRLAQLTESRKKAWSDLEDKVAERTIHLQTVLDNVASGIISTDRDGAIQSFNPAAEKIFGYQERELLKENIAALMPQFFRDREERFNESVSDQDEPRSIVHESTAVKKDGSEFPIAIATGSINRKLCIYSVVDITERKEAEAIRIAKEVAESANNAKSEFLSNVSHEIRTPLNGIYGFLQLVLKSAKKEPPDTNKVIERATLGMDSCKHLMELINDILDFSKIEAGRMDLKLEKTSINAVFDEIESKMNHMALKKGLSMTIVKMDPELYVFADRRSLIQILFNIVGNAVKFTNEGGITISCITLENMMAEIEVRDSGCGIAESDLSKVFERFEQVGKKGDGPRGTGLGMAISKKLVELMGGRIYVISEPGIGSSFRFTLPTSMREDHV